MRTSRPPRGTGSTGPVIPKKHMRDFFRIDVKKEFQQENGGIYKTVEAEESKLKGVLLPLNNEDLQRLPEGTATVNTQKLYTNGESLGVGQQVRDSLDNQVYTVETELTHLPIHGMKRYIVTKKGAATKRG